MHLKHFCAIYSQYFEEYYLNGETADNPVQPVAVSENQNTDIQPLTPDYHQTLRFYAISIDSPAESDRNQYFITTAEPYITRRTRPDVFSLGIFDIYADKGWSGRYVDQGTALLMLGSTGDGGHDIFYIDISGNESLNITGDGNLNSEYFINYVENNQKILFRQKSAANGKIRLAGIDVSGVWYAESEPLTAKLEAAVWKDSSVNAHWNPSGTKYIYRIGS